jgi:hypothetical protein
VTPLAIVGSSSIVSGRRGLCPLSVIFVVMVPILSADGAS